MGSAALIPAGRQNPGKVSFCQGSERVGTKILKIFQVYTDKVNIRHSGNWYLRFFRGSTSWEPPHDHNIMENNLGFS